MFYIIQENIFREPHFEELIATLDRFGLDYEVAKYIPFAKTIEFKTDRKDVFCFGAVSMAQAARQYGWSPGTMYNLNHDMSVYGKFYGKNHMLNGEGSIIKFSDPIPLSNHLFFARPTGDTKSFSGQIFTQDSWREFVDYYKDAKIGTLDGNTSVIVSPLKEIKQEVRCWSVGGKIVTASRYRLGNRTVYQNYDNETFYTDFAQQMVYMYQPSSAFCIDVCLTDDGLKVVEVNCINCAGFYHANMNKLIESLENEFTR